jgi:sortase A
MFKKFLRSYSAIILFVGILLISYSLYEIVMQNHEQTKALNEAQAEISSKKKENGASSPTSYSFQKGEVVGILNIPSLDKKLPIIEGTDEKELEKGVGHYTSTKLPGQKDRIFLAGHRDTVFKRMGELQKGDLLSINMKDASYTYEISEMFIVDETDLSVLEPTAPDEILTLSTCYPFEYLSSTDERYIINARMIEAKKY